MSSTTCYIIVGVGHSGEVRQPLVFEGIIHNIRRDFCSCAAEYVADRSKLQFANVLLLWCVQDPDRVDEEKNQISDRSQWLSFQLLLSGEQKREVNAQQLFCTG